MKGCNTAVILAAGAGTRMKSEKPKVLHEVMGRPMVSHVIAQVRAGGAENIIVVVGHGSEKVTAALKEENVQFAVQTEQLGTGHAVMQAAEFLPEDGGVFVLCGDTPLVTADMLKEFAAYHEKSAGVLTVLTAGMDDPTGYGRIIRAEDGSLLKIVEQKDATEEERAVKEINSGMFCFDAAFLKESLPKLSNDNAQQEYYITDLVGMAVESGRGAAAWQTADPDAIMGVNNRVQLAKAGAVMRRRIVEKHMMAGVTMIDPDSVYIEDSVEIGPDTEIWPGVVLRGNTVIGSGCVIRKDTEITDSTIGDRVEIQRSVIKETKVGSMTTVGPFAYLRPGNVIGEDCRIGDFVEFKNSTFGDRSKASHLAYIGDGDVGTDCNIGCGVVFVNYDGKHKFRSTVGDRAFIGSNSNLVAPVSVQDDGYVAAGSTVTKEVHAGALYLERAEEKQLEGWVERKGLKRGE
ncbi:MAG: bifunctional UDP-N-acetylglucosamine diphosphorylase/glucosamine-1-phosphate N-acetyltransferase GlmU [Firmicutes bacterium]|nr:bifunctional UDP-N-acetylglucosamine diphosphorylase/glucosamine-1-phosphate N-acetyltransferase GlmU [Bacillota bacterium]